MSSALPAVLLVSLPFHTDEPIKGCAYEWNVRHFGSLFFKQFGLKMAVQEWDVVG